MITKLTFKQVCHAIGFKGKEGTTATLSKTYDKHNNYQINIDFEKEKINYGEDIIVDRNTTTNFSQVENFVVLECVNRLLEKGYQPNQITLEKNYPLGHRNKGNLDILVSKDGKAFLMIECKTFGKEYTKETNKMLKDGGQLFSYFQQDQTTQHLCLYASTLNSSNKIEYTNNLVKIEPHFKGLSKEEAFSEWNRTLKDNGIFDSWATPFNIKSKAITRGRLKTLQEHDSGYIFNRFAEILRHNVVSDKPNAFNKIFNLFLCKVVDEEKDDDQELEFQWKESDDHIELLKRLNDLYKRGMRDYLEKGITDFSDNELNEKLARVKGEEAKHEIREMFTKMRLHKNNEFAFKEVFNDASFEENAKVVREVVELLQVYQIRYSHKQQFLSNFFELLLTTGLKQEAGQFFTPVPIAKFIVKCLPIKQPIEKKITEGEVINFLPYVMDYACGSGHFLTEAMDEIQGIISQMHQAEKNYTRTVDKKLAAYTQSPYDWAENFVFGIEKDYRLVKTAKVACFLNGDGEAKVIHADGLAPFNDYKNFPEVNKQENQQEYPAFDVLIANPPYSVSAFKKTLKKGNKNFKLYNRLTDESKEIECLFIERTKQLLKPNGYAGIILPSSILSNTGIYTQAREILLLYFNIVAIVELGSNTFMATGTNTVCLFLQRKTNNHHKAIKAQINNFIAQPENTTCNGIENAFGKYVNQVFEGLSFDDYTSLFSNKPSTALQAHELFSDYQKAYKKTSQAKAFLKKKETKALSKSELGSALFAQSLGYIKACENEKLLYFMLALPQQTLLIKAGEKQTEKDFLGYEFSNRRGHEGIKLYTRPIDGKHNTKLFNPSQLIDTEKVNTHIYQAFLGKAITEVPEALKQHLHPLPLTQLLDFERPQFGKSISLSVKKKVKIETKWELVKIGNLLKSECFVNGFAFKSNNFKNEPSDLTLPVLKIGNISKTNYSVSFPSNTQYHEYKKFEKYIVNKGDLAIALTGATVGKAGWVNSKVLLNQRVLTIKSIDNIRYI